MFSSWHSKCPIEKLLAQDETLKEGLNLPIQIIEKDQAYLIRMPRINELGGYTFLKLAVSSYLFYTSGTLGLIKDGKLEWCKANDSGFTCRYTTTKGELWLGLINNQGIRVYENYDALRQNIFYSILDGNIITNIYKDRQGGLWIMTVEDGVFYAPDENIVSYNATNGLSEDFVKTFTLKNDSLLIIGLWRGDIIEVDHEKGEIKKLQPSPYNAAYNYDLYYDNEFEKLIGGDMGSLLKEGKWSQMLGPFYETERRFGLRKVSSRKHNGHVLLSNRTNTLLANLNTEKITKTTDAFYINSTRHLDANFDNQGNIWISRVDGLWQWTGDSLVRPEYEHPYFYERIEAVEFMSNGDFVLGTKGNGIIIWDGKENLVTITSYEGLTADMIENVFIDEEDQIWVGTLNGLNKVTYLSSGNFKIKQYSKKHGLPGNEITKVRRQGETIWVATTKGLCRMEDEGENLTTSTPLLTEFVVNGTAQALSPFYDLDPDDKNINLSYLAIDYKAGGDILYRYKLKNTSAWEYTKSTSLNFPNMSPGNYELEIQTQNEDGYWSESLVQSFRINPPFWKKLWFLLLVMLAILGLGYFTYSRRLISIQKEHEVKDQLIELERSALQAQMNPHFIFNVLNSIQNAVTQNEKDQAALLLAKFSKLIRATLNNARAEKISLEEEIAYIESYLYLEKVRHKRGFDYNVTHDNDIDPYDTTIPPMLVQPYVENAIKHGLKNVEKGVIGVNYSTEQNYLVISVTDNGHGFQKDTLKNKEYNSVGMAITQRRLELLADQKDKDKMVTVHHLKASDGRVIGTKIMIRVKTT